MKLELTAEKIASDVRKHEVEILTSKLDKFLNKKGIIIGWYESLDIAQYFLDLNNRVREHDKAVIRFVKKTKRGQK